MKFLTLSLFMLFSNSAWSWNYATPIASPITGTTAVAMMPAVAGQGYYVKNLQVFNTSSTVSSVITIQSGSVVVWTGFIPATTAALPLMPIIVDFITPVRIFSGQALNFVVNTAGASIYVSSQGDNYLR